MAINSFLMLKASLDSVIIFFNSVCSLDLITAFVICTIIILILIFICPMDKADR